MKKIYKSQIIYGEMFKAYAIVKNEKVFYNTGYMDICFGNFTQNLQLKYDKMEKAVVTLFFNHDPEILTTLGGKKLLNYTVFESESQCKREFSYIYKHVKPYIDFKYTIRINECDRTFRNRYSDTIYHCNSCIEFEFENCYMYEIFLVLQMYRRFLQLTSKREYWLSKELTRKKWHGLSFVNIAMFCDSFPNLLPFDQKILRNGYIGKSYLTKFTNKTVFKNNKQYLKESKLCNLSAMCVIDLKHYVNCKNKIINTNEINRYPNTSTWQCFDQPLFTTKNIIDRKNVNYTILETAYNNVITNYFKPTKKFLKCMK